MGSHGRGDGSFVAMITLRVVRIVRAARSEGTYTEANRFWDQPPLGHAYSAISAMHIFLAGLYYLKSISALRRLASSVYHMHPDELQRIQRRSLNPTIIPGTRMLPI